MSLTPVWFITGASGGFGLEIAKLVLQQGYRAVLTARDPSRFADIVEQHPDNAIALKLDVTSKPAIAAAVKEALQRFGRIDVLVNNAGYGYLAAIEEGEDDDIRRQFDTNLFGLIDVFFANVKVSKRNITTCMLRLLSNGCLKTMHSLGRHIFL